MRPSFIVTPKLSALARTYGTIDVPNSAASAGITAQLLRK